MGGVLIRMFSMATFAGELMPTSDTKSPTLAATLARVGWINVVHAYTKPLSLVDASLCHHAEKPLRELSTSPATLFSIFADLLDTQILKDKNSVGGNPLAEFRGGLLAERLASVAMFATQPFQKSTDAARILLMCLPVRQLFLKTLACLAGSLVGYFKPLAGDEQSFLFSGGHKRVSGAKVNTDRCVVLDVGNFNCKAKVDFAAAGDRDAVIADGVVEVCLGVIGNNEIKLLATNGSGNGKLALPSEAEILSEQEHRRRALKGESLSGWVAISSSGGVGSGHVPDGCTSHLRRKRRRYGVVDLLVKIKSGQWFANIVRDIRNRLLKAVVFHNQLQKMDGIFDYKRNCSLSLHNSIVS
jgi:hypothetical protein